MKYGCCKNCSCLSKKIRDPGCECGNHEIKEAGEWVMGKRITIVLDDELIKKLHDIQAKLIKESHGYVSFSGVLNDVVRAGLKPKSW